ncbi:MAG TPA: gamma-glutamylcyclotransferase family protein [Terriglobia bacterium]|nr:gamma-glutamylcyclotransferase family protein [Terriglobia bacterium]
MSTVEGTSTTCYVFVYGTLMREFDESWQQRFGARLIGRGKINARLYDLGQYPGAIADERESVIGELYYLRNLKAAIEMLDQYEEYFPSQPRKSLFTRKKTLVEMENGARHSAWTYFYNRSVTEKQRIPAGDYRDRIEPSVKMLSK